MAKRVVSRRGKPSKSGSKKRSKKTPAPAKKRPVRRPIPARSTHGKSPTSATLRRREARELALLIHEQELAARREARREAREALELERLIEEQQEAERQEAREAKAARRRERTKQLQRQGRTEKQARKLVKLEEFFEREGEKEQRKEAQRLEREALQTWQESADAEREKRGKTKKERAAARKADRKAKAEVREYRSIEDYIVESLWEVYNCLGNLGFRVDEPQCWKYQDGSFDAQIRVNDPDDTTGQAAILELEKCIKPVVGAYIALGFRHHPSDRTERRIEKGSIGDKTVPGSLKHKELGMYTNLTNYRPAGVSEIADHINATHEWLGDFGRVNQAFCAQIMVRYYHSPNGRRPPEGEHDRINEGSNPGTTCSK